MRQPRSIVACVSLLAVATLLLSGGGAAGPPQPASRDASLVRACVLDYVNAWYAGDGTLMARAVHPRLAKRIAVTPAGKATELREMTAKQLIEAAGSGAGTKLPAEKRRRDVRVLDIYGNAASARADMHAWIDYLHLAKVDGTWRIVNVLWEYTPDTKASKGYE